MPSSRTCGPTLRVLPEPSHPLRAGSLPPCGRGCRGGTQTYQYDALFRLTQATYPAAPTDTYTYDGNSNRKTKNGSTYSYDAADQMLTDKDAVTYGYDNKW
jgi:YD repeat-containing protein